MPALEWPISSAICPLHYFIVTETVAKSSIQVIDRMFTLLDALERHNAPVNLKQLAADTSLHPSTAHRILNALVANRMVDRVEPGVYRLGMRLSELGRLVQPQTGID
jgi:DNA-binding IclR family transcriptional regulator